MIHFYSFFLGDLPALLNDEDVMAKFSPFGQVVSLRWGQNGRSLFIQYDTEESTQKAFHQAEPVLCGKKIIIDRAKA